MPSLQCFGRRWHVASGERAGRARRGWVRLAAATAHRPCTQPPADAITCQLAPCADSLPAFSAVLATFHLLWFIAFWLGALASALCAVRPCNCRCAQQRSLCSHPDSAPRHPPARCAPRRVVPGER